MVALDGACKQVVGTEVSGEAGEGLLDAGGDWGGVIAEGLVDFKDDGGRRGECLEGLSRGRPVDGAVTGPEVLVLLAVVVVGMDLDDAAGQRGYGLWHAYGDVRMAEVHTDADCIQVADAEDFDQVLGGGGFAGKVFDEQAHAKRTGKGAEVFEGGEGVLDGARGPAVIALAEVEDEVAKGDLLGGFEGALDFVHGVDAAGFLRVQHVDCGSAGAAHFAVGKERGVHGPG